jgi:superfamily I DNA/RNA helicase
MGQTVMLLASCSYMLRPIIAVLRKYGIPFHNPYRRSQGFWNPLRIGSKGACASRILSLLVAHPEYGDNSRQWTYGDLKSWVPWLKPTGILNAGADTRIENSATSLEVGIDDLSELFEPAPFHALVKAFEGDHRQLFDWWRSRVPSLLQKQMRFAEQVLLRSGPSALRESPKVIVGTIHSVKGGEADVVLLFPDLSAKADAAYQRYGPSRDSVIRLFYVGMTRARHALYICQRESSRAVSI